MNSPLDNLKAIGSDGTVVNTGHLGGIITLLEHKLERPVQWFICLLHFNELPFRHIIEKLFKAAARPTAFCGELTKLLHSCEEKPALPGFQRISTDFPDIDSEVLSTDQKYLLDIAKAVSSGKCSKQMANKKPGSKNLKSCTNDLVLTYAFYYILLLINPSSNSNSLSLVPNHLS